VAAYVSQKNPKRGAATVRALVCGKHNLAVAQIDRWGLVMFPKTTRIERPPLNFFLAAASAFNFRSVWHAHLLSVFDQFGRSGGGRLWSAGREGPSEWASNPGRYQSNETHVDIISGELLTANRKTTFSRAGGK
jgi:hypothetical protein